VAAAGLDLFAYRGRPARGEPRGVLVLLHGRAVDEHDLFPLIDELDPEAGLVGAAPRGPLTLPPGGSHWYVVERVGFPHRETFLESFDLLCRWLWALAEDTEVPWERTVIGGFSQGAVMSYALALAAGRPSPAGLLGMSGFIPTVDGFDLDLARPGFPVAITHGSLDPIIGVEFGRTARQRLEASGVRPLYRESPIGHGVDPAVLPDLRAWLEATIGLAGEG
jgi:phospholipase/carboxylesterase